MKKYLLFLSLFAALSITLKAQQPFPLASDNPLWNTVEDYFWDPGVYQNTWMMTGTTQMCGETYQIAESGTPNGLIIGYHKGYTRNQGDSVYYRIDTNCTNPEQLLYDFSLTAGDTFYMDHNPYMAAFNTNPTKHVVQSVSTINYLGIGRKTIEFELGNAPIPMKWIYGVGAETHPFYALLYIGTEEDLLTLCLDSLGTLLYQNPNADSCSIILASPEPNPFKKAVQVYPNPSSQGWSLAPSTGQEIELVEIFDQLGKRVALQETHGLETVRIPAMAETGVYFIRVKIDGQFWSGKLIQTQR